MKRRNMSRTRALCLSATALFGGCVLPAQAWAQSQAQDAASGPPQDSASSDQSTSPADTGIEEIVVTAQKRAEGLQNVPIAITALSGDTLEKSGIEDVGDLTQLTPSLQFGTRATNVFIALRGIGQAGQDIGSQSGVTVSLDGVPLLNHFMMNPAFLDIERVEVLRGPQGTLQGRNATGGAINVYSKEPTNETGGELSFNVGNYKRIGVKGYVNTPLSDTLLARLSFQTDHADGWLKDPYNGRRYDNSNLAEVRGQLLFEPTEALSVRALVEYTHNRDNPEFNVIIRRANPNVPTASEVPGYPYPQNDIANLQDYINDPNIRDVNDLRTTVIARYDVGPNTSITSTTGFIKHNIRLIDIDVDLTPAPTSTFDLIGLYAKQFTQELTFTTDLGSRADLVTGLFYMHGDSSEPLYLSLATVKNYLVYLPAETLDSYAGYAQFRYNLTDRLRATLGGRYTIDRKSYEMDGAVLGAHTLLSDKNTWKAFTPHIGLDFTPNDNSLIYASVSRGFKSGGFNTLGDITQPVNTFNPEYVWNYEAGVKATLFDKRLRFGLTGFYADYTNLQQTVFRTGLGGSDVRYPRVENSSTATIKGVEFEFQAAPITGLLLMGAVTRLDGKFGKFCNNDPLYPGIPTAPSCVGVTVHGAPLPPGAKNLEDNYLPQAPKWQFNTSAQYVFPISDSLEIMAHANYKWQSKVYFDIYNNPLNSQHSYGLLNASLGIGSTDKAWSVTAWVRNAFDERYISQATVKTGATASVNGTIGTPRMYGATFTSRF